MDRIARQIDFLRYLTAAPPGQRKQLLRSVSREQIQVLSEISLNLLQGNVNVNEQDFLILSKHKCMLRRLALKSVDNNTKRDLMYKDANGIRALVIAFLKQFDSESDTDSDLSGTDIEDDESSTENVFFACKNADGDRKRFSKIYSNSGSTFPTTDSKAAGATGVPSSHQPAAAAATTTSTTTTTASTTGVSKPTVSDRSPSYESICDQRFTEHDGETA